jgi:hypothetical protein
MNPYMPLAASAPSSVAFVQLIDGVELVAPMPAKIATPPVGTVTEQLAGLLEM